MCYIHRTPPLPLGGLKGDLGSRLVSYILYCQGAPCQFVVMQHFSSAIDSHAVAEGSIDLEELEDDFTTFYVAGMSDSYNTWYYLLT